MFKNLFSFDGRIRRTEYGLSFIIYVVSAVIVNALIMQDRYSGNSSIYGIVYIPLLWFLWSQGSKRCHDLGKSGWWQVIPFYGLWMIFADGQLFANEYGENPKGYAQPMNTNFYQNPPTNSNVNGYNSGYDGGHNNPNQFADPNKFQSEKPVKPENGYNSGDLYK